MYITPPMVLIMLFLLLARFWLRSTNLLRNMVVNIGIAQNVYDKRINLSKLVNISNLGISSWKTKFYAINESKATIEFVNLDSIWSVGIHNTLQAIAKINKTGIIILNQ